MVERAERWGFAAAAALLLLHALAYVLWCEDDAGVSLRYAENLARGQGLVYNPGERVEAISNLGYVLLLGAVRALLPASHAKLGLVLAAKLLGAVAALFALVETRRLARALGLGPGARLAVLVLVAGSAPFAAWSVGALEVPFVAWGVAALGAAAAELAADEPPGGARRRATLAALMLVFVRVDGFVPVAIVASVLALVRARTRAGRAALARDVAVVVAPAALLVAAMMGWRSRYYGAPWPLPVYAKVDLASSIGALPATLSTYLRGFFLLHGGWPLTLTALGLALVKGAQPRRVTAATAAGICLYAGAVGGDWMPLHRFLAPVVALLVVLIVAALAPLSRALRLSGTVSATLVLGLAAAEALAGHQSFRSRRDVPLWYLHPTLRLEALVEPWIPAVHWLARSLPRDATLLTSEAGFVPYLSELRTLDTYGLATPALARLPRVADVRRTSLGIGTELIAGPATTPAQAVVAGFAADAVVLQERMVQGWNGGRTPPELFAGRWVLAPGSPIGRWAVYVAAERAGAGEGSRRGEGNRR